MRRGWLLLSLSSRSALHQHGEVCAAFPQAARFLATAISHLSAGITTAAPSSAQRQCRQPGLEPFCGHDAAPGGMWRGFAAAAGSGPGGTAGPSPAKLRAVPFTVTREEAVREYEAYHSANWLFKQPSNGVTLTCTQTGS